MLKKLTASPIPFMCQLPPADDLDSTEPLDSVMEAVAHIVKNRIPNFTDEIKRIRELMQQEYEAKVRNAYEEIEELKTTLEENAKDRMAKNERALKRQ